MSDNAILVLTSDHGMSAEGSHGGDSENQTTSFFFVTVKG